MITIAITSCASSGQDKFSEKFVRTHIIQNKTTKSEVQAIYGAPDEQFTSSNIGSSWVYRKSGSYNSLSSLASYIPGADSMVSAVGIAQNNADTISNASNKVSGNAELSGSVLSFSFNDKNVVTSWDLH